MTGKQRMLNAYRGIASDTVAVAPEFWYYYPAKLLGVDMIAFARDVPFHQALRTTFEYFGCEGWGIAGVQVPNETVSYRNTDRWVDDDTLDVRTVCRTPAGDLTSGYRISRQEPAWCTERPIKDLARDLPAWEMAQFGGQPENLDPSGLLTAWHEVGDRYLLEALLGDPFFDVIATARDGGFATAIYDFLEPDVIPTLERLQETYTDYLVRMARAICARTPVESFFLGCTWSCLSLLGPALWRRWDKPVIAAVARELHRHGRLLHVHFHGRCREVAADLAEIGIDCVCPFERPPGGDIATPDDLRDLARLLQGRTTFNGNIHTVETLIRGTADDVRREVGEVLTAFAGNPRVIVGTGDQVGRETPEENLAAMIAAARGWTGLAPEARNGNKEREG